MASRTRLAKFLSTTFVEPLGTQVSEDGFRGYYIDLRVKAKRSGWPDAWPYAPGAQSYVALAQLGLGAYERFVAGEGEEWLALARGVGDMLCDNQIETGGFAHSFDLPHTYPLSAPWISAMSQGQGASLLVRLHLETGDERYAAVARSALGPLRVPVGEGGAMAPLDGRPFPQEFPTDPPAFVLNGGIFAMWGLHDVGRGLGDGDALREFGESVDTLAANLHRWDTGSWSLYDLYPHPIRNWASLAYHQLHINQLHAMAALDPRPELGVIAGRFERYLASRARRMRAFAHKAAFRIAVPRRRQAR